MFGRNVSILSVLMAVFLSIIHGDSIIGDGGSDVLKVSISLEMSRDNGPCGHCAGQKFNQHFRVKGCHPIDDEHCSKCAKSYECPTVHTSPDQCFYAGKTFNIGEEIEDSSPCETCTCAKSSELNKSEIVCDQTECPESVDLATVHKIGRAKKDPKECYFSYKPTECCGTLRCPSNKAKQVRNVSCVHDGKTYRDGERISINCTTCICQAGFNLDTIDSSPACNKKSCYFDIDLLLKGCVPVYERKGCCAIEYHCPMPPLSEREKHCHTKPSNGNCYDNNTSYYFDTEENECKPFSFTGCSEELSVFNDEKSCIKYCTENDVEPVKPQKGKCYFDGKNHDIGSILQTESQYTCTCKVPPDFTCIGTR